MAKRPSLARGVPLTDTMSTKQPDSIPRAVHQVWFGPISPMCWCSSASWKAFSEHHGWAYRLWLDADLPVLRRNFTGAAASLWDRNEPHWLKRQQGLVRASIFKLEVLRQYGGVYVDCDLSWLGAATSSSSAIAPTHLVDSLFIRALGQQPAPFV